MHLAGNWVSTRKKRESSCHVIRIEFQVFVTYVTLELGQKNSQVPVIVAFSAPWLLIQYAWLDRL